MHLSEQDQDVVGDQEEDTAFEEVRPMFQVLPHDLPKRRIRGKSSPVLPQQEQDPSLRSLREGGEHDGGDLQKLLRKTKNGNRKRCWNRLHCNIKGYRSYYKRMR